MSWLGPAAVRGGKAVIKYGPQAKMAWDAVGKEATGAARSFARRQADRRRAFTKAGTVKSGAVLQLIEAGQPIWLVLSEGEPVDCYPDAAAEWRELMRTADATRAVTWEEHQSSRMRNRVRRNSASTPTTVVEVDEAQADGPP